MNKLGFTRLGPHLHWLSKVTPRSTRLIGPARDKNKVTSWDEVDRTKISQIFVWHGLKIYAIQFQYVEEDGNLELSEVFGSTHRAPKFHSIQLNYPSEQIISVSGIYCQTTDELSSLKIVTNLKSYGPYGCLQKLGGGYEEFEYEVGMGQFGGFYGESDLEGIKFIGIYLKPAMTLDALNLIEETVEVKGDEKVRVKVEKA